MKSILCTALFGFVLLCTFNAADAKSVILGHNLGTTTETPPAETVTAGTYLVSYSPTDRLLVGTSPWMLWGYNSLNAVARYRWDRPEKTFEAISLQAAYLKSGQFANDFYRQEIGMLWLTGKIAVNPFYDFYLTANYMYFWNETVPFSLRREPFNDEKYQLSLTTLHTMKYSDSWFVNLEFGVLGLRARYPQTHSGVSLVFKQASYLVQLGFTVTSTAYNFERLLQDERKSASVVSYYDSSVHPEIQAQWFF